MNSDDRPPASGRPSLLSAEQQGEADRQRILSGLDSKPILTSAGVEKARSSTVRWIVTGVAVLVITAGAGAWLVSEGEKEIVLAGTAPLPAAPVPAAPLASEPVVSAVPPPVAPEEVSTAAILEDTPVMADASVKQAGVGKDTDELKSLLEKDLPPVTKSVAPVPMVLADAAPYAGKAVAAKPASATVKPAALPVKAAAKPAPAKTSAKAAAKTSSKPVAKKQGAAKSDGKQRTKNSAVPAKKKEAPKAVRKEDSDVALLAALVAHSKATQPKRPSTAAGKLKQCRTLGSVAEAEQCRTQLCSGSAKNEAECKAARLAKASGDS